MTLLVVIALRISRLVFVRFLARCYFHSLGQRQSKTLRVKL